MLSYWMQVGRQYNTDWTVDILYDQCQDIVGRLNSSHIEDAEVIHSNEHDVNFQLLAKSIRDGIQRNEVQGVVDRLHTFLVKYFRALLIRHGLKYDKITQLQSMCSTYVKHLKENNLIQSAMTERILKSTISILDAFNNVRNEQSFAHDNGLLNKDESLLILKYVSSTVHFINTVEIELNKMEGIIKNNKGTNH